MMRFLILLTFFLFANASIVFYDDGKKIECTAYSMGYTDDNFQFSGEVVKVSTKCDDKPLSYVKDKVSFITVTGCYPYEKAKQSKEALGMVMTYYGGFGRLRYLLNAKDPRDIGTPGVEIEQECAKKLAKLIDKNVTVTVTPDYDPFINIYYSKGWIAYSVISIIIESGVIVFSFYKIYSFKEDRWYIPNFRNVSLSLIILACCIRIINDIDPMSVNLLIPYAVRTAIVTFHLTLTIIVNCIVALRINEVLRKNITNIATYHKCFVYPLSILAPLIFISDVIASGYRASLTNQNLAGYISMSMIIFSLILSTSFYCYVYTKLRQQSANSKGSGRKRSNLLNVMSINIALMVIYICVCILFVTPIAYMAIGYPVLYVLAIELVTFINISQINLFVPVKHSSSNSNTNSTTSPISMSNFTQVQA